MSTRKLNPILKWAGGKEQELKYIIPNLPDHFENYYEPFVGGGAVYTAIKAQHYFINDRSEELITLYRCITNEDRNMFFAALDEIIHNWDQVTTTVEEHAAFLVQTYKQYSGGTIDDDKLKTILFDLIHAHAEQFNAMFSSLFNFNTEHFIKEIKVNLIRKMKRMKVLEQIKHQLPDTDILDNIETAFKSAFYMHVRYIYNNTMKYKVNTSLRSAVFLFIRNFAYSGMFRYNSNGAFNVPYGGIDYNRKNFSRKVDYLRTAELRSLLQDTTIENLDFEEFLHSHQPGEQDLIFLDPPYDSEFSTYAKNEFTRDDQTRLANYLISSCKSMFMLIIKNTEFVHSLYANKGLRIRSFDKTYLVSFMNRNDKSAEHLLITNY